MSEAINRIQGQQGEPVTNRTTAALLAELREKLELAKGTRR